MRPLSAIPLLLLILFQTALKPAVMLQWKLDQQRITDKYCVNKQNPMMHCDGKCYLAKQFRKLEMEEQRERSKYPFPAQKLKLAETTFLCPDSILPVIAEVRDAQSNPYPAAGQQYHFDFKADNFHPPQA